jgi:glycosyltransferase involved in cell wall biosynthesis
MYQPLFSVLIANFNNGKYLSEAINSVVKQSYTNWEIIFVDDASSDNSIESIAGLNDPRIKIYTNKKNYGCGFTKRKCVQLATGNICGFLDPDDALHPQALEILVNAHSKHEQAAVVYSTHLECNQNLEPQTTPLWVGQIAEGYSQMNAPGGYTISHFATFKRDLYFKTEGINANLKSAVDQDLYYKLEETGPVVFVNQPLYYYRHHEQGISLFSNSGKARMNHLKVMRKTLKRRHKNKCTLISLEKHELNTLFFEYHKAKVLQAYNQKKYLVMYRQMVKCLPFIGSDKERLIVRLAAQPLKNLFFFFKLA